jgi:hypothetical protein
LVVLYRRSTDVDSILVESGSYQLAPLQTHFSQPLKAKVTNYLGQPLSGKSVTFTAPANGPSGTFADTHTNTSSAVTNANGNATSSMFSANSTRVTMDASMGC